MNVQNSKRHLLTLLKAMFLNLNFVLSNYSCSAERPIIESSVAYFT